MASPPRFAPSAREVRAARAAVGVQGSRVTLLGEEEGETEVPLFTRARSRRCGAPLWSNYLATELSERGRGHTICLVRPHHRSGHGLGKNTDPFILEQELSSTLRSSPYRHPLSTLSISACYLMDASPGTSKHLSSPASVLPCCAYSAYCPPIACEQYGEIRSNADEWEGTHVSVESVVRRLARQILSLLS